ncbi:spore germination protein GerPE [Bacillus songklensis]|uniref:Spore germination protein GerPE n=1 Tax=Bacillus songklensis TaxID=1069116 RepID=A0ABV8B1W6_9BACI
MQKRMSCVNKLDIITILFGSICQIGDSVCVDANSKVLAVQREYPLFYGREGRFEDYTVFREPFTPPKPRFINMCVQNEIPVIKVNNIKLTALSTSSIVHIGSSETVNMEARVKNIRQLIGERTPPNNP